MDIVPINVVLAFFLTVMGCIHIMLAIIDKNRWMRLLLLATGTLLLGIAIVLIIL